MITEEELLYDGCESQDLYERVFKVHDITFKITDFINNSLSKVFYQPEEHFLVYYLVKSNRLYIFSYGEKQPSRYLLFFLGVYPISVHSKF